MSGNRRENLLSIILLSYQSGERIVRCYERLQHVMDQAGIPFELVVVDDGSNDDSYEIALELEARTDNVRAYQLSRNYTSHYSIFAGLSLCEGACATPIPDDEQQPYELLVEMYRLWERGEKVIMPYRESRDDPWSSRTFSLMFYKVMNKFSDIMFPPMGLDTFFIDREVIDVLNERIHPINTTTMTEIMRLGFSPRYIPYSRPLGLNGKKSRWTLRKKIKLALDTFISSSSFPIKAISLAGFAFSALGVMFSIFQIYIHLFGNSHFWGVRVPGWTSMVVVTTFFGGMILLALGVIAEYIWRIYEEVKARPGYIVRRKPERIAAEQVVDNEMEQRLLMKLVERPHRDAA